MTKAHLPRQMSFIQKTELQQENHIREKIIILP
jgi:hypothetical protein